MPRSRSAERSLLGARLAAQRLSGAPAADVVDATRHLLAVELNLWNGHSRAAAEALQRDAAAVETYLSNSPPLSSTPSS